VGFIGAGQMGLPMVERLRDAGYELVVHARRPEKREQLSHLGVAVAPTVAEAAAGAEVLCVCTFDDSQLRDVVFGTTGHDGVLAALGPGAVLVNHTTGSPDLASEMAAGAPSGVGVLDAPVSGSADDIRAGRLTVLVGGAAEDLERARGCLSSYAATILHVGAVGDASRVKLVNNLAFTVQLRVAALTSELGRSLGIDGHVLADAVGHCSAASRAMALLGGRDPAEMMAGARPFLAKDLDVIRRTAAQMGLELGALGEMAAWVEVSPPRG
jgi:3-hydroxyisobutyrate dehydrogenase-like beta-hydroxyacid dehydrogenase